MLLALFLQLAAADNRDAATFKARVAVFKSDSLRRLEGSWLAAHDETVTFLPPTCPACPTRTHPRERHRSSARRRGP